MNKPKWQRCRLIKSPTLRELEGRELWVIVGRPIKAAGFCADTGNYREVPESYLTNLIHPRDHTEGAIPRECVELLARDENDFADAVPFIPWEQWLKESAPRNT